MASGLEILQVNSASSGGKYKRGHTIQKIFSNYIFVQLRVSIENTLYKIENYLANIQDTEPSAVRMDIIPTG